MRAEWDLDDEMAGLAYQYELEQRQKEEQENGNHTVTDAD